jgi:tetratricopeptide (TPR) repeat protein
LAAGYPVIVLQNLSFSWFPIWHYSLVIGYDLTANLIILHSGKRARKHLSLSTFERTWARANHWGLLVLHPGILPATAEEELYISAVIGLERAQRWREALKAYITALNKWPDNYTAHIGLGNCYYAMGNIKEAEVIFRGITVRFPNKGPGFNNLAQVLSDQGKLDEAMNYINKAMGIEGPLIEQYQKTLKEIQIKKKLMSPD